MLIFLPGDRQSFKHVTMHNCTSQYISLIFYCPIAVYFLRLKTYWLCLQLKDYAAARLGRVSSSFMICEASFLPRKIIFGAKFMIPSKFKDKIWKENYGVSELALKIVQLNRY